MVRVTCTQRNGRLTLRAKGYTIKQIFTYGAGLFNGFVNPISMEALTWRYCIVWVVMLGVWFVLVWFLFPEAAGRTLEEVSRIFDGTDIHTAASAHIRHKTERAEAKETV